MFWIVIFALSFLCFSLLESGLDQPIFDEKVSKTPAATNHWSQNNLYI